MKELQSRDWLLVFIVLYCCRITLLGRAVFFIPVFCVPLHPVANRCGILESY